MIIVSEIYDVVDEQDRVIGKASREECHEKGLIHRTVQVYIVLNDGRVVLQKRSETADTFPGRYTAPAAGHVDAGERYEDAAVRELREEMGLDVPLKRVGNVKSCDPKHMQHIMVFSGFSDGPFSTQGETAELVDLQRTEIEQRMQNQPEAFTTACIETYRLLQKFVF